jgi:hypothetical protein
MYFSQLISLSDNKTKAIWNIVKAETGTKCHPDAMSSVLENDNLVINPNRAADAFSSYFLEILEELKLRDVHIDSGIPYIMSHNSIIHL